MKGCNKGDIDLPLNITNPIPESLKPIYILELLIFFNYQVVTPLFLFYNIEILVFVKVKQTLYNMNKRVTLQYLKHKVSSNMS